MNLPELLLEINTLCSRTTPENVTAVTDIIRRHVLEIGDFDHEVFFRALQSVDRRGWSERGLATEDDLVHSLDLTLVVHDWVSRRGGDVVGATLAALFHEAGEPLFQDTRPGEIAPDQKIIHERAAMYELARKCGRDIISPHWEWYTSGEGDAGLVEQLDKFVTVREAARRGVMEEFLDYYISKGIFTDRELLSILDAVPRVG